MIQDIRDYESIQEAIVGSEETIPSKEVYAKLDEGNLVRNWRAYHGLTLFELVEAAWISKANYQEWKAHRQPQALTATVSALNPTLEGIV